MTPAFNSWQAFFNMGGYGFYVWLALTITILTMIVIVTQTYFQHRAILTEVYQRQKRQLRIAQSRLKNTNGKD